jgi:hypothetical protein
LSIGIIDAASINASTSGGLIMEDPGSFLGAFFTVTGASSAPGFHEILQGSLGPLDFNNENGNGSFDDGFTANLTTITGGHDAGDWILTTGGTTTVNLHNPNGGDQISWNGFTDNSDNFGTTFDGQFVNISDDSVAFTENDGTENTQGAHTTTINSFVVVGSNPGVNDDVVNFDANSWGFGGNTHGGTYFGLLEGDGGTVNSTQHFANMFLAAQPGATLAANSDVVVYELNSFAGGLSALVSALGKSGGAINFDFAPGNHDTFDMLFAYNNGSGGVNISSIQFEGDAAGDTSTANLTITNSHNLVTLTTITGGVGSLYNEFLAHHSNIFFSN